MSDLFFLVAGLIVLVSGGELLMRGALGAARALDISPLLSGLIIVGFGTSMPELVVSLQATLNNQSDIAIGNVVGSDIANVLLILGLCAVISPLKITPLSLNRDAVMFIAVTVLFIVMGRNGTLGTIDGLILLSTLAAYLFWAYRSERSAVTPEAIVHQAEAETVTQLPLSTLWIVVAVIAGLLLLIGGSAVLLQGATGIAQHLGVSDAMIGLTLVAVGTSLPELSISVIAALRGQADVAVGNVLGSNIFNVLGILGISSALNPLAISGRILQFDQWVMLATALLLWFFLITGRQLSRPEGSAFLLAYASYLYLSFVHY